MTWEGGQALAQFNFRGAGAFGEEVSLTGRYFTAEKALAANLINRVTPAGQVMETAEAIAAIRRCRFALEFGLGVGFWIAMRRRLHFNKHRCACT